MKLSFKMKTMATVFGTLALGLTMSTAQAATCDLSQTIGSSCNISGTVYENPNNSAYVGSGLIDPFLTVQHNKTESGFSTDAASNNLPLDVKRAEGNGQFTRSFTLGELGTVSVGGQSYYKFFLDINEPEHASGIALNLLQIYNAGQVGSINLGAGTTLSDLGKLFGGPLYDLGANTIHLNYNLFGSGSGRDFDMDVLIPTSLFAGLSDSSRLVFATSLGGSGCGSCKWDSNGGFEEWSFLGKPNAVPEPGSLGLLGLALVGLAGARRRKSA